METRTSGSEGGLGKRTGRKTGTAPQPDPYVWRDQAEHAAESRRRAAGVVVMGRLQQRTWTAEDGSARSVVEVVRDHLEEIRDETGYSVPAGVADEIASLVERLR